MGIRPGNCMGNPERPRTYDSRPVPPVERLDDVRTDLQIKAGETKIVVLLKSGERIYGIVSAIGGNELRIQGVDAPIRVNQIAVDTEGFFEIKVDKVQ